MTTLERPETRSPGGPGPAFPQSSAFVLQFAADAGPDTGLFHGKVQHVASGRQVSFQSTEELWSFVRDVLAAVHVGPAAQLAGGDGSA
jgi:hypothetical protein